MSDLFSPSVLAVLVAGTILYNLVNKHLNSIGTILVSIEKDVGEIKAEIIAAKNQKSEQRHPWQTNGDDA